MATNKPEAALIAAMIKQAREAKGWTRYELAKNAHMSEAHIMRIEQAQFCIRVDVLNKLAKTLEMGVTFPLDK
jgi:ribosome-binding protein aMBF1 (putative translation factor)